MDRLEIRNSLINGENAYTVGDWHGSNPCHWHSSKMILKPFERENHSSN
jgi:hypothetical protein